MKNCIDLLNKKFGKDSLMALATVDEQGCPWVRTIDAVFCTDSFYTVTYALSNKMQHIQNNPNVAISGDWFSARATGENMGHIKSEKNEKTADMLRAAFADWYDNGHINEDDPNTVILRIKLTHGVLFDNGIRYEF